MGNLIIPGETALSGRIYKDWLAHHGIEGKVAEAVKDPPVGLRNVKNMCFLNAILQCFYHTPMLRRNLSLACESAVVKDQWLIQLHQLFTQMDESRRSQNLIAATEMASLIQAASTNGEFQHGEQADAHEAFMLLVSKLLEGCISSRGLSLTEKEQIEQSSLIGHIFGMSLSQSVRCKHCGDKSVHCRSEYCFCVTCPLEKNGERRFNMDVKDLLTTHTQEEHINEWKCDKCSKVGCVRQAGIAHPPNVLPVHISRLQRGFGPTVTFEKELTVQCDPPSPGKKKTQVKYALYGVIVYRSMGSNGGHYFAFVRSGRGANEQWYVADDDEVRSVTWPEVTREEPFMLLYEAVNVVPPLITEPERRLFEEEQIQKEARRKAEAEAAAREEKRLRLKQEEAFSLFHQRQQAEVERVRQSIMNWSHRGQAEATSKQLEHEDPYTPPGTELSSTTAGSEGRGFRHDDHAWSPPQETRRRSIMDFSRWSLFHSCQCSVPSAEYSDSLEDDAMHCM